MENQSQHKNTHFAQLQTQKRIVVENNSSMTNHDGHLIVITTVISTIISMIQKSVIGMENMAP